jgi:hypothetical protein
VVEGDWIEDCLSAEITRTKRVSPKRKPQLTTTETLAPKKVQKIEDTRYEVISIPQSNKPPPPPVPKTPPKNKPKQTTVPGYKVMELKPAPTPATTVATPVTASVTPTVAQQPDMGMFTQGFTTVSTQNGFTLVNIPPAASLSVAPASTPVQYAVPAQVFMQAEVSLGSSRDRIVLFAIQSQWET